MNVTKKQMRSIQMIHRLVERRISMRMSDKFNSNDCGNAYSEALELLIREQVFPTTGDNDYVFEMAYYAIELKKVNCIS